MKQALIILLALLFCGAVSVSAEEILIVSKVAAEPTIDGKTEALWDAAQPTTIKVEKIPEEVIAMNLAKQQGKYAKNWKKTKFTEISEVELKAVRTNDRIFFLARWKDDTKDDQHKPWKWQGDKETGEYVAGSEREDRLAFMFQLNGIFHPNVLYDNVGERSVDVWQWKAARTNPVGMIHDKSHIYSRVPLKGKYSMHYTEKGNEVYVSRPGDGGISPYKTNKIDPFVYQGDVVPRYIPFIPEKAGAADVKGKGDWQSGVWTVEAGRDLDTGFSNTDTVFNPAKDGEMAIAVFNHVGDHFHARSKTIKLVYK
jgi:hypothetical protein